MAWKVSDEYNKVIYSGDAQHKLKLLFNNVEYETANVKTESVKIKDNILSSGEERFSLDNFVSKEAEIIIHDIELSDIKEPVNISIGTLVGNSYEYVPIGIFNLQETPTTDNGKTTIKLRDNSVKFDYPYDASGIIKENGGSVSMLVLLQDICTKFGVELGTLDFLNKDTKISVWDNIIKARQYIMYIAEKAGCIAKIDRLGRLILVDLNKEEDKLVTSTTNDININDSLPRKLKEYKVFGKSTQETRSGKNKFSLNKLNWSTTTTSPILTINSDNSCVISKTNPVAYDLIRADITNFLEVGKTYIASTNISNKDYGLFVFDEYNGSTRVQASKNKIKIIDGYTYYIKIYVNRTSSAYDGDLSITYTDMQIEEGITETSFEKYGASPSPDYPSEIISIPSVENLLDESLLVDTSTTNGITFEKNDDNTFNLSGTVVGSTYNKTLLTLSEDLQPNENYYFYCSQPYNSATFNICVRVYFSDNTFQNIIPDRNTKIQNKKITATYVVFYAGVGTTVDTANNVRLMLSKKASDYVPYGHWLKVKDTGKNLLNLNEVNRVAQGLTINAKGSEILINGTSNNTYCNVSSRYYLDKPLEPNTYHFTTIRENIDNELYIRLYYDDGTYTNVGENRYLNTKKKIVSYYFFMPTTNGQVISNSKIKVQLERNSTATEYEPYKEQSTLIDMNIYDENGNITGHHELCSIGDTKDKLTIDNDKAKIIKRIGKVVLNGSKGWASIGSKGYVLPVAANVFPNRKISIYDGFVSHFKLKKSPNAWTNLYDCGWNNTGVFWVRDDHTIATTLDEWKTWLSNNPVTVYYVLAEPEEFTLEPTQIKLYEGVNNISLIDDLETNIELQYQQKKIPIEIPTKLLESYKVGDKIKISRVVYEDAIRKFEFGDESNETLYINSANPYITDSKEIENVYEYIKDFEIYSLSTGKIIGNPALDSDDLIKYTHDGKTYITLGQNTLNYNGVMIQNFNTQVGTKEKTKENVTLNTEDSNFKRIYTRIDQAEGNIILNTSQITNIQTDLKDNYYNLEQTNRLIQNAQSGLTNTFSEAGGNNIFRNTGLWFENSGEESQNNPYEFWNGKVSKIKEEKASNMSALLLQKATLYQEQLVPDGNYTISFKYKKLIQLSNVKLKINDTEYLLTETNETQFEKSINANSQHINVQFISDTNNSCEIYDLMVNAGTVKLAYSQNQNETTTDTVNISKGITITSTETDTTFKANSDGIRIYDSKDLANPKTKFTDKGTETDYLKAKNEAEVVDILIQKVGNHTWLTKI